MSRQTKEAFAELLLNRWRIVNPVEPLLLVHGANVQDPEAGAALSRAATPVLGGGGVRMMSQVPDYGETMETPQRTYMAVDSDAMDPDPGRVEGVDTGDHGPDAVRRLGAWRWRLMQRNSERLLPLLEGRRVLDFGGAAGPVGYGCDIVDHGADMRALYDADGTYDTIYTSHTLEHIVDLDLALLCIREKLAAGGYLIAHVPSWEKEALRHANWPHHYQTFGLGNDADHPAWGHDWRLLDRAVEDWADVEWTDRDGHSLLMVARKR